MAEGTKGQVQRNDCSRSALYYVHKIANSNVNEMTTMLTAEKTPLAHYFLSFNNLFRFIQWPNLDVFTNN